MSFWNRPQDVVWRKLLFHVHLWTGIGVGSYVLLIGVTGASLVFREELEPVLTPQISAFDGPPLAFEEIRRGTEKKFPDKKVQWILQRSAPGSPWDVWIKDRETFKIFIDPHNGDVIGVPTRGRGDVLGFLQDLHFNLLGGNTGRIVNGIGAGFLTLLVATGLVVWWPGIRNWRRSFKVNWRARWRRVNWDLHSAVGIWTVAFPLIWGITGVYFAFPQPFQAAVRAMLPESPQSPDLIPVRPTGPPKTLDELVAIAEKTIPGWKTTWIGIFEAKNKREYISIYSGWPENMATIVDLDPSTGEVLRVNDRSAPEGGDAVFYWFDRLHFGDFGGWPIKVAWTLLGLAPAFLFVTGALMWWNRVLSKKWARLRRSPSQQDRSVPDEAAVEQTVAKPHRS